jgi:hypothetical protein
MGSVKRLEFDALPRVGGWDYIYLNDDIRDLKETYEISRSSFNMDLIKTGLLWIHSRYD